MLSIYPVCLAVASQVVDLAGRIALHDRDMARQLRRSVVSIALNVAEGSGCDGGTRRQRYKDALGSARESLANLEVAEVVGYLDVLAPELRCQFDHIIGVLVRNVYVNSRFGAKSTGR